jgi:hypothetical protein
MAITKEQHEAEIGENYSNKSQKANERRINKMKIEQFIEATKERE